MNNVKIVPNSKFNLFSLTKRQNDGWILGGNKDSIWLEKDGAKIKFDIRIETAEGVIFAIYIKRNTGEVSNVSADKTTRMSVN